MAYQSLYRRYRPRRFSDVRGQEHVVRALRNAVRDERVGHAYLFTGPRGTGKTSTARILAKALNCEGLHDGEPDGTCESCLAIDAGTSYDVQELDAASNNGVADVRDLIGRVNLGSPGRTKVYILDEVHMLTAQASAALLKTLEEPPAHVVFVLATTDPQKVLPTIKSRTQQYDFHLLSADELAEHVAWVIHDADLGLDPDVIDHVVRQGAGSARDTLSALDQVAAAGGVFDEGDSLDDLLDAVASADPPAALTAVAAAVSAGRDPRVLGESLLGRFRDVFLVRMGGAIDHLPSDEIDRIRTWADRLGDRATTRALELIGDALLEMRQAPDPRIPLEVALVKITRADAGADLAALAERVARLEAALASGGTPAAPGGSPAPSGASGPAGRAGGAAQASERAGPSAAAPTPDPPSSRPTPPPVPGRGGGGRAAAAREALARVGRPGASPAPSPPSPAAAPAPASTAPPGPSPTRGAGPAPTASAPRPPSAPGNRPPAPALPAADGHPNPPAEGSETAAPPAAPSAGSTSGGPGDLEDLNRLWHDEVIPELTGMTKAMFNVGRFTAFDGAVAVLALPNEVHRQKCQQKQPEVETVLRGRLGPGLRLDLVVDESGEDGGRRGGGSSPEPDDDYDLGGADVHDLENAPDAPAGGIDVLTEAFPGAEIIES